MCEVVVRGTLTPDGRLELDHPVALPPGEVRVTIESLSSDSSEESPTEPSLYDRLKGVVGKARGLPPDASANVDHYLYGHAKQ